MATELRPEYFDPAARVDLREGIWYAGRGVTREERRFLRQYREIRQAEGRGRAGAAWYLRLPYVLASDDRPAEWRERARSMEWLLDRYAGELRGRRVLDAGAGNCWLSHRLAEQGARPVALDLDDREEDGLGAGGVMMEISGHHFDRVCVSFEQLPFRPESFDLIIFNGALHYAEDLFSVIANCRELLRGEAGEIVVMDSPVYRDAASGEAMVRERGGPRRGGYLTRDRIAAIAGALELELTLVPRRPGLIDRVRRLWQRLRLGREPAAMPWIVLAPKRGR